MVVEIGGYWGRWGCVGGVWDVGDGLGRCSSSLMVEIVCAGWARITGANLINW